MFGLGPIYERIKVFCLCIVLKQRDLEKRGSINRIDVYCLFTLWMRFFSLRIATVVVRQSGEQSKTDNRSSKLQPEMVTMVPDGARLFRSPEWGERGEGSLVSSNNKILSHSLALRLIPSANKKRRMRKGLKNKGRGEKYTNQVVCCLLHWARQASLVIRPVKPENKKNHGAPLIRKGNIPFHRQLCIFRCQYFLPSKTKTSRPGMVTAAGHRIIFSCLQSLTVT